MRRTTAVTKGESFQKAFVFRIRPVGDRGITIEFLPPTNSCAVNPQDKIESTSVLVDGHLRYMKVLQVVLQVDVL